MIRIGRHVFQPSGIKDAADVETCAVCPLPRPNDIHRMPDVHPDQRAAEQRRVGEHEDN